VRHRRHVSGCCAHWRGASAAAGPASLAACCVPACLPRACTTDSGVQGAGVVVTLCVGNTRNPPPPRPRPHTCTCTPTDNRGGHAGATTLRRTIQTSAARPRRQTLTQAHCCCCCCCCCCRCCRGWLALPHPARRRQHGHHPRLPPQLLRQRPRQPRQPRPAAAAARLAAPVAWLAASV
jgi:hypothetical protein